MLLNMVCKCTEWFGNLIMEMYVMYFEKENV